MKLKYRQYDHPDGTIIVYENNTVEFIPMFEDGSDLDFDSSIDLELLAEDIAEFED